MVGCNSEGRIIDAICDILGRLEHHGRSTMIQQRGIGCRCFDDRALTLVAVMLFLL